jgi:hypothetical protein
VPAPLESPVVVDGILSDEKVAELLGLRTEYPELDFKATADLTATEGKVELAKDVGAMQVKGGYIVVGVDNGGKPTGDLDTTDVRLFDESRLSAMLRKWLPAPLELRTRVLDRDGHRVVLIYIARNTAGCAFFTADGSYERNGKLVNAFSRGDVYWREGTSSVRMDQQGLETVIAQRIADEKVAWIDEQQEIRQREQANLQAAYQSRAPLGSVTLDMPSAALNSAALELVREDDRIALQHLERDALARAKKFIERGEIESELGELLDKLACLAATFLAYGLREEFERVVDLLTKIYSMPLEKADGEAFEMVTRISSGEPGPRVWLQVIERVYALGALAVRQEDWPAVRTLTLQHPPRVPDYHPNWLRHALTMASRAQHLREQGSGGQTLELSLLRLAESVAARLDCLRPDGLAADDNALLTSLAQFDVLSNIVAIDGADRLGGGVFFPNFARVYQHRVTPIVERLLVDSDMRQALFKGEDDELATALGAIEGAARHEGFRFDGFDTWDRTRVGAFIDEHIPGGRASSR